MPKPVTPSQHAPTNKPPQVKTIMPPAGTNTAEANAHISGVYFEFSESIKRYNHLMAESLNLNARLQIAEKMLCLVRDQLQLTVVQAGCAATPLDWEPAFAEVRFVGVRLTDACMTLLQERGKLSPENLLQGLNGGMFRFRTRSPLREIHAALIQQRSRVKKIGNEYVWAGGGEQISMRLRMPTAQTVSVPTTIDVVQEGEKAS